MPIVKTDVKGLCKCSVYTLLRITVCYKKVYFFFLSVQYAVHLFRYLKGWLKNPKLSFTCCLALLLPLSDIQGAVSGLIETVGQGEEIEIPSALAVVKDRGAVPIETDDKSDKTAVEIPQNLLCCTKCHQGTQTEPFTSSTVHLGVNTRL